MIEVQVIGNVGHVWSVEEVRALRTQYRILGSFAGVAPKSMEIGLPLILLPEELQLLREKQVVRLYELVLGDNPPVDLVQMAEAHKEESYQSQIEEFKTERIEVIHKMADIIVVGKRRKQLEKLKRKRRFDELRLETEKRRKEKVVARPAVVELSSDEEQQQQEEAGEVSIREREHLISQEIAKIKPITREMAVVQIFERDPWLDLQERRESSWSFAQEGSSRCRLFVFKDLWNHNYFITEGSKFGGDFLVYCGDPVMYHAKYIVICVTSGADIVNPARMQDLVARSRLGNSVKKIVLFAWLEGENVKYKSVRRGVVK